MQRAWHTRKRIVESMMEIVRTTGLQPTMAEVARAAGISVRALFVHFPDLESLVRAGSDLVRERVATIKESISPDAALATRIADYVAYRAAYFEMMGKVWRVGFLLAQRFPEVHANRAGYRDHERTRQCQIFAKELDPLPASAPAGGLDGGVGFSFLGRIARGRRLEYSPGRAGGRGDDAGDLDAALSPRAIF